MMGNGSSFKGLKILISALLIFLVLSIPTAAILFPIQFIGNMFKNTWGTVEEYFGYDYAGNFSEEADFYMAQNRISLN